MSAHRPGPWVAKDVKRYDGAILVEAGEQQTTIALVVLDAGVHANAALIAAAPDLLAAVKALMAWGDHPDLTGRPHGAPVDPDAPSFDATVKLAHAALTKVRGGGA